jgi:hypothetical protein
MSRLPATIDEAKMIDTVAHWLDLVAVTLQTENSRLHVQTVLKRMIRQGTVSTLRVIEWAERESSVDADIALRQVASEMLDNHELLPATIAGYVAKALNRPLPARPRKDPVDNLLRDQAIAVVVSVAIQRWHPYLPFTRNRASKSPSACSVGSAALIKRRVNIGERRVEKICQNLFELLPAHSAWLASLSASDPA